MAYLTGRLFSLAVANILKHLKVNFKSVNVLEDKDIREGIKIFSDWPTIPQLYIKKEFIGGCDIIKEMFENGELQKKFQEKEIKLDILQQTKDGLINKRNSEAREQLRKEKAAIKEQELLREIAFHENVAYGDAQFPIEIRAPYEKDLGSIRDVAAGPDYRGPTSAEQDKS